MHRNLCTLTMSMKYAKKIIFRAYLTGIVLSKIEVKWLIKEWDGALWTLVSCS